MILIGCLLFALSLGELATPAPSRFYLDAGKSVIMDQSKELKMDDVNQFFDFLSSGQRTAKRTFGRIATSLVYRRKHSVIILLDTDLKSNQASLSSSIPISSKNNQFTRFGSAVFRHSYTIASADVNEAAAHDLVPLVEGTPIKDGIIVDGVEFLTTVPSEARFIDDMRKASLLPTFYQELTSLRPSGNIELTLTSTYDLPAEKQSVARSVLLRLVQKAKDSIVSENNAIFAVVFTDFTNRQKGHTEHSSTRAIQPKTALVTATYFRPITANYSISTSRANSKRSNDDSSNPNQIGFPAPITGDATFHIFFWTIIFLFIAFITVSVLMWRMKTFEDPLIYFTEYVLDSDDTIMEEEL